MKKNRKKIIIITVALSLIFIFFVMFFITKGILTKPDNEGIESLSIEDGNAIGIVSDVGDVYIRGIISQKNNFGTDFIQRSFDFIRSWLFIDYNNIFIRIYDKNDAVSVNLSENGGCIITKQSDVYVFVNGSSVYKTPTLLCSGYKKAYLAGDKVYLLRSDGAFGTVDIDNPSEFNELGSNVVDFDVEYSSYKPYPYEVYFALTEDNRLYIMNADETINNSGKYIDNVVNFDTVSVASKEPSHGDDDIKKHINISLLNSNNQVFWYEGNLFEDYSKIADINNYTLTGSDISKFVSYSSGIAMLYDKAQVSVYGYDLSNEDFISGEVVFNDVKDIFSGDDSLIILYQNGKIDYFGFSAEENSYRFIKEPYWH